MKLPTKIDLGEFVRTEMARKDIRNKELADKLNITLATVTALRNGTASYQLYDEVLILLNNWSTNDHQ